MVTFVSRKSKVIPSKSPIGTDTIIKNKTTQKMLYLRHFAIDNVIPNFSLGVSEFGNFIGYFLIGDNIFARYVLL